MERLPKENIYTVRCPKCGCLIMLSGDELLECWEPEPSDNPRYKYKCPGCGNRTSHTTKQLLMTDDVSRYIDLDDYSYAMDRTLGHGIILDEGEKI